MKCCKCGTDVLRNYLDIYFEKNVVKKINVTYSDICDSSIVCKNNE